MNRGELTGKNPRRIIKPKHGVHYSNIPVSLDLKSSVEPQLRCFFAV